MTLRFHVLLAIAGSLAVLGAARSAAELPLSALDAGPLTKLDAEYVVTKENSAHRRPDDMFRSWVHPIRVNGRKGDVFQLIITKQSKTFGPDIRQTDAISIGYTPGARGDDIREVMTLTLLADGVHTLRSASVGIANDYKTLTDPEPYKVLLKRVR